MRKTLLSLGCVFRAEINHTSIWVTNQFSFHRATLINETILPSCIIFQLNLNKENHPYYDLIEPKGIWCVLIETITKRKYCLCGFLPFASNSNTWLIWMIWLFLRSIRQKKKVLLCKFAHAWTELLKVGWCIVCIVFEFYSIIEVGVEPLLQDRSNRMGRSVVWLKSTRLTSMTHSTPPENKR